MILRALEVHWFFWYISFLDIASCKYEDLKDTKKKLKGYNFYLLKIKIELLLTSLDLWNIVDKIKETPSIHGNIHIKSCE